MAQQSTQPENLTLDDLLNWTKKPNQIMAEIDSELTQQRQEILSCINEYIEEDLPQLVDPNKIFTY